MFDDEWRPHVDAFIINTVEEINSSLLCCTFTNEQKRNDNLSKRNKLSYIMQYLKKISKTILKNTLEHLQETVNFNVGFTLDEEFENLEKEFYEIKAHAVSVLTSSIVKLLKQEGLLNEQICNHSTETDLNAGKETCAGYLRTLLRLTLTDIGQMAQHGRELFTEFQSNFGISFESEISKTADTLTKILEEDAEPKSYIQTMNAFILTAISNAKIL